MVRVLLVEDDFDLRSLFEHILLGEGHSVDVAGTVREAASLLETHAYDLVIADGVLPDGSGAAVADQAKERGSKALIITGNALRMSKEELERHEYVLKPLRRQELLAAIAQQLAPEKPFFTILVVEDDRAVRDMVIRVLSELAFGVLTASDPYEALSILAERPVHLLVADIVLPGMDGVRLAEVAKAIRPQIKVLFATGFPTMAAARDAASHGKLLYKPLRRAELLREVEAALAA